MKGLDRFVVPVSLVLLWACGGAETEDGTGDDSEYPTVETVVPAETGGKVTSFGGAAVLEIPAGALGADTTITVKEIPSSGEAKTLIYDFSPDGIQFSVPATLSIRLTEQPPEGQRAVIAWRASGSDPWTPIEDSEVQEGACRAPIDHFTQFTVLFVAGGSTPEPQFIPLECRKWTDGFSACGGDLAGTWDIEANCLAVPNFEYLDNMNFCEGLVQEVQVITEGTITFSASSLDSGNAQTPQYKVHLTVPKSCVRSGQCYDAQQMVRDRDSHSKMSVTCTDAGSSCDCTGGGTGQPLVIPSMPYTSSDGTLTFGTGLQAQYCVQGDTLEMIWAQPSAPHDFGYLRAKRR